MISFTANLSDGRSGLDLVTICKVRGGSCPRTFAPTPRRWGTPCRARRQRAPQPRREAAARATRVAPFAATRVTIECRSCASYVEHPIRGLKHRRESEYRPRIVRLARLQDRRRELRLVRRVGEVLRLEAERRSAARTRAPPLPVHRAVEEVAGVELHARLRRRDLQRAAARRLGRRARRAPSPARLAGSSTQLWS